MYRMSRQSEASIAINFQFPNGFSRIYLMGREYYLDVYFQFPNGFSPILYSIDI